MLASLHCVANAGGGSSRRSLTIAGSAMKEVLKARFDQNLSRVRNVAEIYEHKLAGNKQGRRPVGSTDILRAAVVLLHATVEEFLRGILEWRLPDQGETTLNSVPLVGSGSERPEKFLLGRLAAHRTKTVDAVIRESVEASLARSNSNNVAEIVSALSSIGLDKTPCEPHFGELSALMERRHRIVHRADRNPNRGQGQHSASSIGRHHVREWAQAAQNFFDATYAQLPD